MGDKTGIAWTDATWNPIRGCSRVSEGCRNCYAERVAARFSDPGQAYEGLAVRKLGYGVSAPMTPRWTGEVRLAPEALDLPLRWKRPRRIFVNSMSDLFHEKVPYEWIDRIFAVMALAPQHTFQVLTKRPDRMRGYFLDAGTDQARRFHVGYRAQELWTTGAVHRAQGQYAPDPGWPLPNVWLGVSVEDQPTADERIPLLLQTPTALRWVSYEPALGAVDFSRLTLLKGEGLSPGAWLNALTGHVAGPDDVLDAHLDWLVVGGESGPGARQFDLAWARSAIAQCRAAGVPVFVKQLGARSVSANGTGAGAVWQMTDELIRPLRLRDRKGADPAEWPEDLRVREFPESPVILPAPGRGR